MPRIETCNRLANGIIGKTRVAPVCKKKVRTEVGDTRAEDLETGLDQRRECRSCWQVDDI